MFFTKIDLKHLKTFTVANLKSRYRNTFYGFAWVILNPILTYLVQVFAFTTLFRVTFENFAVYLCAGLFPWIFIVQSIEMCSGAFIYNNTIVKNFPINPIILVGMQILDNFTNFLLAFGLILASFLITQKITFVSLLLVIPPTLSLLLAVSSLALMLAILNVRYRDAKFVISFGLNLFFYLTPIFYSIEMVSEKHRGVLEYNPFYILLKPFQQTFLNYPLSEIMISTSHSLTLSFLIYGVSFFVWKRMKDTVVLYA